MSIIHTVSITRGEILGDNFNPELNNVLKLSKAKEIGASVNPRFTRHYVKDKLAKYEAKFEPEKITRLIGAHASESVKSTDRDSWVQNQD